jgi:two-component system LytT family response regulator
MRTLIVDDERLARSELRRMLRDYREIDIIGEAADAESALGLIAEVDPDLLFLDIQMPGKDGFQLLQELGTAPRVVFTTAFDTYALKAFDANALDYLLKPIDPRRLAEAIHKVLGEGPRIATPQSQAEARLGAEDRVFVKDGESCWFVRLGDVRVMKSEGNYTRLYFDEHKPLILRSLNQLDAKLDRKTFFRCDRKHIVNLKWIERIDQDAEGRITVQVGRMPEVQMSRRRSQEFRALLSI